MHSIRRLLAALAAIALLVAMGGCASDDDTKQDDDTGSSSAESTALDVEVRDGAVVGEQRKWKVEQGSRVSVSISSDVADEVHLHGYDVKADVKAGETAELAFTAKDVGVYELELEDAGLVLGDVQVEP